MAKKSPKAHTKTNTSSQEKLFVEIQNSFLALKLGPLFLETDYMFFGNSSKAVNAFIGLSIPFGKRKS